MTDLRIVNTEHKTSKGPESTMLKRREHTSELKQPNLAMIKKVIHLPTIV